MKARFCYACGSRLIRHCDESDGSVWMSCPHDHPSIETLIDDARDQHLTDGLDCLRTGGEDPQWPTDHATRIACRTVLDFIAATDKHYQRIDEAEQAAFDAQRETMTPDEIASEQAYVTAMAPLTVEVTSHRLSKPETEDTVLGLRMLAVASKREGIHDHAISCERLADTIEVATAVTLDGVTSDAPKDGQ